MKPVAFAALFCLTAAALGASVQPFAPPDPASARVSATAQPAATGAAPASPHASAAPATDVPQHALALASTVYFEPNLGQGPDGALFVARGAGLAAVFPGKVRIGDVAISFGDAAAPVAPVPELPLPGRSSYFHGSEPSAWLSGVAHYGVLRMPDVAPGVDVVLYGRGSELEWDFVVAPGADASLARWTVSGHDALRLDGGDLVVASPGGHLRVRAPAAFQPAPEPASGRVEVPVAFVPLGDTVAFALGAYDPTRELAIDPSIVWGAHFGGYGRDYVNALEMSDDPAEPTMAYIGGTTYTGTAATYAGGAKPFPNPSGDMPFDDDPVWPTYQAEGFIAKVDTAQQGAAALQWVAFLGGSSTDEVNDIDVHPGGIVVGGTTYSKAAPPNGFPTPNGAKTDWTYSGASEAFIAHVSLDGSALLYGSIFGSIADNYPDEGYAVAATPDGGGVLVGSIYHLASEGPDYPMVGGFQMTHGDAVGPTGGGWDGFVARFDFSMSGPESLAWSTYYGGFGPDRPRDVAVASDGKVWVTGETFCACSFAAGKPIYIRPDAYMQPSEANRYQVFLTAFPADGGGGDDELPFASLFGGKYDPANNVLGDDYGYGLALDGPYAYITGETDALDFPTTPDAVQTCKGVDYFTASCKGGPGQDAFVLKVDTTKTGAAQLVAGTYLGGTQWNAKSDVCNYQPTCGGTLNRFEPYGYEAGRSVAIGPDGSVYVFGAAYSERTAACDGVSSGNGFTVDTPNVYQPIAHCRDEAFIVKLNSDLSGSGDPFEPVYRVLVGGTGDDGYYGFQGYEISPHPGDVGLDGYPVMGTWGASASLGWAAKGFQDPGSDFDAILVRLGKGPPDLPSPCTVNGVASGYDLPRGVTASFSVAPAIEGDAPVDDGSYKWWLDYPTDYPASPSPTGVTSFTYAYPAATVPGTKTIRVEVKDTSGLEPDDDSVECTVDVVNQYPIPYVEGPTSGVEGATLTFDSKLGKIPGTYDPDGATPAVLWQLNDLTGVACVDPATAKVSFTGAKLQCTFAKAGNYKLVLVATDSDGWSCSVPSGCPTALSWSHPVTITAPAYALPVPAFAASMVDPLTGGKLSLAQLFTCGGPVLVTFTDLTAPGTKPVVSWAWDVTGDGKPEGTSAQGQPFTWLLGAGTHPVTLTVTDAGGKSASVTVPITIAGLVPPTAKIGEGLGGGPYSPGYAQVFHDLSLAGSSPIATRAWSLSDGAAIDAQLAVFEHGFGPGMHSVELTVTDTKGCQAADAFLFVVKAPAAPLPVDGGAIHSPVGPQAFFRATPHAPLAGETVRLEDLSVPGAAPIGSFEWDLGDGSPPVYDQRVVHRYAEPGAYTVRLKVRDLAGLEDEAAMELRVVTASERALAAAVRPVADAGKDLQVHAGETVQLDGTGSRGALLRFAWRQVEGPAVALAGAGTPMPLFTAPPLPHARLEDTAIFELVVTDGVRASAPDRVVVRIVPPPGPGFTYKSAGEAVSFLVYGVPAGANVTWDFGDGGAGQGFAPEHVFPKAGAYTVTMRFAEGSAGGATLGEVQQDVEVGGTKARRPAPEPSEEPTVLGMTLPTAVGMFVLVALLLGLLLAFLVRRQEK